jgi:Methyltransferase domain
MNLPSFAEIFQNHVGKVSDKWSIYLPIYDRTFFRFRPKPVNLLEIGIQNGGSLEVYAKYFPNFKTLVGCDINPRCAELKYSGNIHVVVGDCNRNDVQARVKAIAPVYDIIIDDGSHTSPDIINAFFRYFPMLQRGGVFVIEDLHCSYWKDWEGGLLYPQSSMAFLKALADVINVQHWGNGMSASTYLQALMPSHALQIRQDVLEEIASIQFYNSVCVIEKAPTRAHTQLGKRVVRGSTAGSAPGIPTLDGTDPAIVDQSGNVYAHFRQS